MPLATCCERCGTALSYGETFRHRLALEVKHSGLASRQILGDSLAPRRPRSICGECRDVAEPLPAAPRAEAKPWLLPLAAFCGAMLATVVLRRM